MRTFNEQLKVAGVSSYEEWVKTKKTDFRLLLLTQGAYLCAPANQIANYWAVFTYCPNNLIEVRIARSFGFGPLKGLRFVDPNDPLHPLNQSEMTLYLHMDEVEREMSEAERYADSLWSDYQQRREALYKKCELEKRQPKPEELRGLNKPSRPHDIYRYLMRNDIKILKEKQK